jgi:hypothetical protein
VTTARVCLALVVASLATLPMAAAQQQTPPLTSNNTIGNISGNQGIITLGQTGNNYLGNTPRRLADPRAAAVKADLLSLPRGKTVKVISVGGDSESIQFADDIVKFLEQNGFSVLISQNYFLGPMKGLHRRDTTDEVDLTIGSP